MVDSKLADIVAATTPLDGTELVYIVQSGHDRKATASDFGGGSAGGSDKQVQFNDGGTAFGGDAGFTYDKTNNAVTVARGTLTATSAPGFEISATWNNGAVTFDPLLRIDLTNTAALYSYVAEVNVGTLPVFRIDPFGIRCASFVLDIDGIGTSTMGMDFNGAAGAFEMFLSGAVDFQILVGNNDFQILQNNGFIRLQTNNTDTSFRASGGDVGDCVFSVDVAHDIVVFGQPALADSTVPALKKNSTTLEVRLGDNSAYTDLHTLTTQCEPVDIANLPGTPLTGMIAAVDDGDPALAWGATVVNTGAGATPYLVWYNGTNWTVIGS